MKNKIGSRKSILVVLVLYKLKAEDSPAYRSLSCLLEADPEAAVAIEFLLSDNTPYIQSSPAGFTGRYLRDTTNPGLASRYNQALALASDDEVPWLMLLDQDTTLTLEYLREVLTESRRLSDSEDSVPQPVVALVPKLVEGGRVQSPHGRPTVKHTALDPMAHGLWNVPLYAFNSGSVIRVQALRDIGGFPLDFWLDFLDHATFHLLQAQGGRLFVLQACLAHELSSNDRVNKPAISRERYQGILDAERLFFRRYGTTSDRIYSRIRLLRVFGRTLLIRRQLRLALQALKAAARF